MKKQPQITAATRKNLINAFCSLYIHKPLEKITVQEIVRKAEYNRSTFYQYFKDTSDLLAYLEDEIIKKIKERIGTNFDQVDFADSFIRSFSGLLEETTNYVAVLLANPNNTKFAQRIKTALMPILLQHFNISENDQKSTYVLEFYLGGIISTTNYWLYDKEKLSAGEVGQLIHTLLTEGVLSALRNDNTTSI